VYLLAIEPLLIEYMAYASELKRGVHRVTQESDTLLVFDIPLMLDAL